MTLVGLLYSARIAEAKPLALEICRWLDDNQASTWLSPVKELTSHDDHISQSDLFVVLGGDGTTLAVARAAAPFGIPVFGVNLGKVGFLSEAEPDEWQIKLAQVLSGAYWLERRLMLKAEVLRAGQAVGALDALNDVVVSRGEQVRVVQFHLHVDGEHVTTYTADGLIVATPTGSTAYSMAVGGPLLPPQLKNFLIIPVAPHLSFERPVVLHQEAMVKITVEMNHVALATADGQNAIHLCDGDEVLVSKHENESIFARVDSPGYFYNRLMQRLGFWSRKM